MREIALLEQDTIDKIAAGEVVERPASVVKELVENAVDAGANAVTVEISEGGTKLVRITDNGSGIPGDQIRTAFLRHATSKIRTVDDLLTAGTLGFRGEALSSIAAVCQVETITKTAGSLTGVRYVIEGGREKTMEEIGAPEGTTFLVHNLFYNTPARKKFLKTATTEAGYVSDLMERMALSHPEISFKFINNKDTKLHTSGNCNLRDIIYGIYGREITSNLVKIDADYGRIRISGFIGKPVISRGNRNYENYFVNGRYVKSAIVARAIEDAYKPFMMSHRYPFTVLMIQVDTEQVDVNVHPTKMEVRFADQQEIYERVSQTIRDGLMNRELIPEFTIDEKRKKTEQSRKGMENFQRGSGENGESSREASGRSESGTAAVNGSETGQKMNGSAGIPRYPEPFEKIRSQLIAEANSPYEVKYPERDRRAGAMKPVTGMLHPAMGAYTSEAAGNGPERQNNVTAPGQPEGGTTEINAAASGQLGPGTTERNVAAPVPVGDGTTERNTTAPGQLGNGTTEGNAAAPGQPGGGTTEINAAASGQSETGTTEGNAAAPGQPGDSVTGENAAVPGQSETGTTEGNAAVSGQPGTGMTEAGVQENSSSFGSSRELQVTIPPTARNTPAQEALLEDAARLAEEAQRQKAVQMELFDSKLLSQESIPRHKLIGQLFDTYWMVEFEDKLYIIDQHAAHEKVMYERMMKQLQEKQQTSQQITPPVIVSLSLQEEELLRHHKKEFQAVGFEIEPFGGKEYSIRAVPGNLYSIASRELFLEILDGLSDVSERASDQIIRERLASMSCKAAVKGNHRLSVQEADALIGELLELENPYNCPHGRPTIVSLTKYELEKKFKRIV